MRRAAMASPAVMLNVIGGRLNNGASDDEIEAGMGNGSILAGRDENDMRGK